MKENPLKNTSDDELVLNATIMKGSNSAEGALAELTRRHTVALQKSAKSADRYAEKMMGLSWIVGIVAFLQLAIAVIGLSVSIEVKIGIGTMAVVIVGFVFRDVIKDFKH